MEKKLRQSDYAIFKPGKSLRYSYLPIYRACREKAKVHGKYKGTVNREKIDLVFYCKTWQAFGGNTVVHSK